MASEIISEILGKIGNMLLDDPGYLGGVEILYVEIAPGVVAISIFEDVGDHIRYRFPYRHDFSDPLFELWYAEDADKRWTAMSYILSDGRFDVHFAYDERLSRDQDDDERRTVEVRKYLGDKPILYPPLSDLPPPPRPALKPEKGQAASSSG